jgi:diguanylate cyclase (GGDEF)-like protein
VSERAKDRLSTGWPTTLGKLRSLLGGGAFAIRHPFSLRPGSEGQPATATDENSMLRRRVQELSEARDEAVEATSAQAVTHREQVTALSRIALTDELTGLPNRRALDRELDREISRAARQASNVCVAMLDLDHFKDFNDTKGHQAGDTLLRDTTTAWLGQLRGADVMARGGVIARYGGDEFIAVLSDCGREQASIVIRRLGAAVPAGQTCSAGIACWDGVESSAQLLERADGALYDAKGTGRNRAVLAPDSGFPVAP